MPLLGEYKQAVREGLAECPDINPWQKIGLVALIVVSERQAIIDERNFLATPQVDSAGAVRPGPESDKAVLDKELKEILGES